MNAERPPPERWVPPPALGADLPPAERDHWRRRARLGTVLIVLGIAGILWGTFHMLDKVGGPERRDFAHRQTYDDVKPKVHGAMLGSLLRGLLGLALAVTGAKLRGQALRRLAPGARPVDR
jgi:hypothetical protein